MYFPHYVNGFETLRLVHVDSRYRGGYEFIAGEQVFSEKTEIILYAKGAFQYSKVKSGISFHENEAATGEQSDKGFWRWAYSESGGPQLILDFEDRRVLTLTVNYSEGKGLLLDGKRFTIRKKG